jgi:hypothetical protein
LRIRSQFGIIFGLAAILNLAISSRSFLTVSAHLRARRGFAETGTLASACLALLLALGAAVFILQWVDLSP